MNAFLLLLVSIFQVVVETVSSFFLPMPRQVSLNLPGQKGTSQNLWQVRSIDTVKFSRDLAKAKLDDPDFSAVIDEQLAAISATGATHVAIATPYDSEFLPFLRQWVNCARKYHLKVWFRGNFSGWEGWFGYQRIDRVEHKKLTSDFILSNPDLFEDGDIFTACPECENGGAGDPRQTGDTKGFRNFLIEEFKVTSDAFLKINKHVISNYDSMNLDVAKLVMDKSTTLSLGGVVTVDHYVADPVKLVSDLKEVAFNSGGEVVLGEFGVPLPDINGPMTEHQQAQWTAEALKELSNEGTVVIGLNYWTSFGGTTRLWNEDGAARESVSVIRDYYRSSK